MKRLAAAILFENGKILLGKRSAAREFYPNVWDFIGGHCDENESFSDAMIREMTEEIGVIATEFRHFLTVEKAPHFVLQVFIVSDWTGDISNLQADENKEIRWFSVSEAKFLAFPDEEYKNILNLFSQGNFASRKK